MNYYEHHLGDYAQATSHLSFVEDAAYSRCIRKYYSDERPLPADIGAVQRLVGARTKEEKSAVETVLQEFFFLEPDGWHNRRADKEIEKFRAKSLKAKESANARWMRTHCERSANAVPTQSEGNALQTPDTKHHSSIAKAIGKKRTAVDRPESVGEEVWASFLTLRSAKKAPVTAAAMAGIQREAIRAGISLDQALEHCCARGWAGFKAEWIQGQGQALSRGAQTMAALTRGLSAPKPPQFWTTEAPEVVEIVDECKRLV